MSTEPKKKKSLIKRIFKWTGITFLVLLIAVIAAPFLFKDKLIQLVKDEANKSLNAKVDFGQFDLTLISSFPDFRFKIQNVSVINVEPFAGDTLAYIKQLSFDLNLKSVLSGDKYQINSLIVDEPHINATVNNEGKASWDIAKASTDTVQAATPADTAASKFALKLNTLEINHAKITYNDIQGNTYANLNDIDFNNYANELINEISKSYPSIANAIKIKTNIIHTSLSINAAIPCGLILNELLTNCYKHAFLNKVEGCIDVSFQNNNNDFKLVVKDNGVGLPEGYDKKQSLGVSVICALTEQLNGTSAFKNDNGTYFELKFKNQME
jgi:two-component sensor histidine kinase